MWFASNYREKIMKRHELKKIIKEEIKNFLNEDMYETIGTIKIKKIKLVKQGSINLNEVYVDFDQVKNFFDGKDVVGVNNNGSEVWVNARDYHQITIMY